MAEWTVGEWVVMVIAAIGGITGYAVLIVYVFTLKHNMPEQWAEIKEHKKEVDAEIKALRERIHDAEKKITRECAVQQERKSWSVREKGDD